MNVLSVVVITHRCRVVDVDIIIIGEASVAVLVHTVFRCSSLPACHSPSLHPGCALSAPSDGVARGTAVAQDVNPKPVTVVPATRPPARPLVREM